MTRAALLTVALGVAAFSQMPPPGPRIGYVYPAGGQQGASIEIVAGGQFLNGVSGIAVTGSGVQGTIVEHNRPLSNVQIGELREKFKELTERKAAARQPWTEADEKLLAQIRGKLANLVRRPQNPAIAETVRVQLSIALDATKGERELRLLTPAGLTNPLKFHVGALAERSESHAAVTPAPETVPLPAVVNGQILPGTIDRYRLELANGEKLAASAQARSLIPYISDAVPGWFQAALTLFDPAGREVASASNNLFNQDPVLVYEAPEAGTYQLEIRDSIFRGREDFVYRVTLGPPPGLKPAAKSNDKREREPNDDTRRAMALKFPFAIEGQIGTPGDVDVFRFNGRAGETIVAEILARRQGSPLDSILRLTDQAGKELAVNDDFEDKASGLLTHHADSLIQVKLPKSGVYFMHVGDTQGQGGAGVFYRLRVARPRPDFELRVVPASVNIVGGMNTPVTVHALRREGFDGDIRLSLKDPPAGFALSGGRIPAGADKVRLTLTAPPSAAGSRYSLRLEGRASIAGKEVSKAAAPAEDMMQAFAYHHLVPAQEWLAAVTGPGRPRAPWRYSSDAPLRLRPGGQASLEVSSPLGRNINTAEIRLALNDPPAGVAIDSVAPSGNGFSITVKSDVRLAAGLQGNLIIDAFVERTGDKNQVRRVPIGTLPAVPFVVVPQ